MSSPKASAGSPAPGPAPAPAAVPVAAPRHDPLRYLQHVKAKPAERTPEWYASKAIAPLKPMASRKRWFMLACVGTVVAIDATVWYGWMGGRNTQVDEREVVRLMEKRNGN